MNTRTTRALALLATAAAMLAIGCGGDDDENGGGGGSGAEQVAQPSRLAIDLSGTAKKPTFTVPDSVEGGVVELEFTSSVPGEHSAQLVRGDEGHTAADALEAGAAWGEKGKPLPEWAILAGGTGDLKQGETVTVTQELEPGSYIVTDLASNASAEFEVTDASGGGELEGDGGTITATEYDFETDGLTAGRNRVLFENAGQEPHLVAAIGIREGATFQEVKRFFRTEKGRPPIDESRGFSTAVVEGGVRQAVEFDLEAGRYALLCFVPDRKGGPPHIAQGMIAEAEVAG
jgi:hypothetical protein